MSNVRMPIKRVNISNLMTFEWCFLVSKYNQKCNAVSFFTVLHHVPWNIFIYNAAQCFHQFIMVFIYCLLSFFSDAADSKHSWPVEIPVECSVFKCNMQRSIPRSLQLKTCYVIFRNKNVQFRFKISMADTSRNQLMTNDKLPAFRVELKIFTKFAFKLVFRVSVISVS